MDYSFWAHVEGTSDSHILEDPSGLDGEPEIPKLVPFLVSENVGYLDIAMNDSLLAQIVQSLTHS